MNGETDLTMLFAMQRANGDWFAFYSHGRTVVPLFNNSVDAMSMRANNPELLLFKPARLNAASVKTLIPETGVTCDFCIVETESLNLKRGLLIDEAQLLLRVGIGNG